MSKYFDGRLKLGLIDTDFGDTEVVFGADFKYQFWSVAGTVPKSFDMAFGGFLEYVDISSFSVLQLGGHLIGSYPFTLANGSVLSPYGRFNIRLESYSNGTSDSEIKFGLNGGVEWQATNTLSLFGEFQIDGNDGIFFGLAYDVL
jgi:hypothetical protein